MTRSLSRRKATLAALLIGTALATTSPAPVAAQEAAADVDLRGVTALRATIGPLSAAALECGLRGHVLLGDLEARLAAGGIAPAPQIGDLATITVITGHDAATGLCSSAVMLGAYARESFVDRRVGWIRTGYVVLWQSGVMVTSGAVDHADTVRDALDRLGDALIEEWHRSNLDP